jgi:hypothetical protein
VRFAGELMRAVFAAYLGFIGAGLVFMFVIAALQR